MKRILRRTTQISVTCGLLAVIGLFVWHKVFAPDTRSSDRQRPSSADRQSPGEQVDWRQLGDRAYYKRDWNTAVEAYKRELEQHPQSLPALVRMAYALHSAGRLDEALEAHVRASRSQYARSWSLYNIACVYAVKKEPELALEYLRQAIDAGFRGQRPMREDPDLESLVGNPEFERLEELAKPMHMRDAYHRVDFLIGRWQLLGSDAEREGTFEIHRDTSRFAARGLFADAARPFTATVTAYYDARIDKWRQLWLESEGNIIDLTEANSSLIGMELEGVWVQPNGDEHGAKVRFEGASDEAVTIALLVSRDGHVTWETVFRTAMQRMPMGGPNDLDKLPGQPEIDGRIEADE